MNPSSDLTWTNPLTPTRALPTGVVQTGQKRSRPVENLASGPPASVQKLNSSSSVQEAWNILLSHGMTPDQISLLHSRASTAQTTSTESKSSIDSQNDNSISQTGCSEMDSRGRADGASSSTDQQYLTTLPKVDIVEEKEQRLVTLLMKLMDEYNGGNKLKPVPTDENIQISSHEKNFENTGCQASQISHQRTSNGSSDNMLAPPYDNSGDSETVQSSLQITPTAPAEIPSYQNPVLSINSTQHASSELCETCSQNHGVQKLYETIETLQNEIAELTAEQEPEAPLPPRLCFLYRVHCQCGSENRPGIFDLSRTSVFLDPPQRIVGDKKWHLQGYTYAPAENVLLDQNPDIAVLVYKDYMCKTDSAQCSGQWDPKVNKTSIGSQKSISPNSESMMLNSQDLQQALHWIMRETDAVVSNSDNLLLRAEMRAPYHSFYHSRGEVRQRLNRLSETYQELVQLFIDYIEESFEGSFAEANILFSQGLISAATLHYLFEPKMNVIQRKSGVDFVFETNSWLEDIPAERKTIKDVGVLHCSSFGFDGHFIRRQRKFRLEWHGSQHEVLPITSLEVYPLKYAEPGLEGVLLSRGEKFWACRKRRYISYDDPELLVASAEVGARYMIDPVMHKQSFPDFYKSDPEDETLEDSELPTPPSRDFFLLLPPTVNGYSMQLKRWLPLKVAHIESVMWNLEAFDSLVVDEDTKILVKALVTNQLAKEKSTDLISGKGNGLIILLHGGPGTGKTLTAERLKFRIFLVFKVNSKPRNSVAELAKKPLYRVTCGDIGTNADAIDKHLQKVLYLGRLWGCVVLLDEADVFLEERSLADMQRNALVSVFLRVLEYYDGILVLTSNRVGTFDEAFKSRIQLSLHYENLTRIQRRAIWANFFKRLEKIEPDTVDTSSLYQHLDDLALQDMNGRQIRNSLTTARQLAMYQEKKMDYGVLKHVIAVASKFDQYVKSVKHGITDDELAREGGVR